MTRGTRHRSGTSDARPPGMHAPPDRLGVRVAIRRTGRPLPVPRMCCPHSRSGPSAPRSRTPRLSVSIFHHVDRRPSRTLSKRRDAVLVGPGYVVAGHRTPRSGRGKPMSGRLHESGRVAGGDRSGLGGRLAPFATIHLRPDSGGATCAPSCAFAHFGRMEQLNTCLAS